MIFLTTIFQAFGTIDPPTGVTEYGTFIEGGPGRFIANIIKLLIVGAGIFAVFNFILAGYGFLSSGGEPKKVAEAWSRIYLSILGLVFVAGGFIIGAIVSNILFGDVNTIFELQIFGPGDTQG